MLARYPELKRRVVEMLREGNWISEIAQQIGVSVDLIRDWRREDRQFDDEYREAENAFVDQIDKEAHRRAFQGTQEYVLHQGRVVLDPVTGQPMVRRHYSDQLAMFILKGRRRDVYGDKSEHTVALTTPEELDDMRKRLEDRLTAITHQPAEG